MISSPRQRRYGSNVVRGNVVAMTGNPNRYRDVWSPLEPRIYLGKAVGGLCYGLAPDHDPFFKAPGKRDQPFIGPRSVRPPLMI